MTTRKEKKIWINGPIRCWYADVKIQPIMYSGPATLKVDSTNDPKITYPHRLTFPIQVMMPSGGSSMRKGISDKELEHMNYDELEPEEGKHE